MMTGMEISTAVAFAVILPSLLVAHNVADHWAQTSWQAANKGRAGWLGRKACATHVITYTAATAAAVAFVWGTLGLAISPWGFVAGQLVSALTHYWADRRTTLAWLARLAGKAEFYQLGKPRPIIARGSIDDGAMTSVALDNPCLGTGAYALDQAWHWGWLLVATWVTAKT